MDTIGTFWTAYDVLLVSLLIQLPHITQIPP